MTERPARPDYDVAVVGGGLIGATAALGLARQGRRVLLLEPRRPVARAGRLGLDLRTVAVSPASRELLAGLGVWRRLTVAPYRRMEVWEERGTEAMVFDAGDVARGELGWIVETGAATAALWSALEQEPTATVELCRVADVILAPDRVTLRLDTDATASAQLVVAADGARSPVRARLGVSVRRFDMAQVAVATAARTERPHHGAAYQRFLLDGPVALLPTREPDVCSVVWSQSPGAAERRLAAPDADFCADLGRAVQHRLGAVVEVDQRVDFSLEQLLAEHFNPEPRVLLIGDAGRVLHPLAGLGANVGFEDVRDLLGVLRALPRDGDAGAAGLWRAFDRQRRARAGLMLGIMGGLRRVYARGDPVSQWLRNAGVGWLNRATPVKRQIMVEAMGLGPVARGRAAGPAAGADH